MILFAFSAMAIFANRDHHLLDGKGWVEGRCQGKDLLTFELAFLARSFDSIFGSLTADTNKLNLANVKTAPL
jgi:hypothetical protein